VITITRLSNLQADDVKAVTDPDITDIELSEREKELLKAAKGKLILFYLRGTMIFGTSRVISSKNSQVEGRCALIIDITNVTHLGVSAALSLEESILDMNRAGRSVYIVASDGQPLQRLNKMGLLQKIPSENVVAKRIDAFEHLHKLQQDTGLFKNCDNVGA